MRSVPKSIRIPRINFSYPGWFVVVFGLLYTSFLTAQNGLTIAGNIFDENNRPVPFATVIQTATLKGTMCDEKGFFTLNTLKKEKVVLEISSIGFEQKTVEIAPESNYVELTENLQSSATMVSEVEVVRESHSEVLKRSGFAVSSIDARKLQGMSMDVNDLIDRAPGVRVRRNGGLGSPASYNINGLSGRSVRVFIDGVPAESYGPSFSVNSIPNSLIERTEIYKGVVPIEFGVDAMGGVINIVTKNHNHSNLSASYSGGSFNTHRADFNGAWRGKKTGITTRLTTFYNYSDNDYDVWSDDIKIKDYNQFLPDGSRNPDYSTVIAQGIRVRRFHDVYHSYGLAADVGITNKPWADEFFTTLTLSEGYRESQHGPRMITPYGERYYTDQTRAASVRYKKKDWLLNGLNVTTSFLYSLSDRAVVDTTTNSYDWYGNIIPLVSGVEPTQGESGTPSLNVDDNTNYVGNLNASYAINERHMISFNYAYNLYVRSSDDALQEAEVRSYGSRNSVNKQISGFSYQNALFDQKLRSSVFVKHYFNNILQNRVEFSNNQLDTISSSRPSNDWGFGATLSLKLSKRVRINASGEKALRLVSTNEVFGNVSDEIVESPQLDPEKSYNLNLGGVVTLLDKSRHRLELNTNLFFRDTYDRIRRNVIVRNDDSYSVFQNIGHINSKGIELQLDYHIKQKWHAMVQGYYLDSRFLEKYALDGSDNLNYKSREPNMPWLTASASLTRYFVGLFRHNDRFSANWYFSYIHQFYFDWDVLGNQNKPLIPTQVINDIGISYRFANQHWSLSLDARNIFDQLAFDNYAIQKPGRAFYGKITYRIF